MQGRLPACDSLNVVGVESNYLGWRPMGARGLGVILRASGVGMGVSCLESVRANTNIGPSIGAFGDAFQLNRSSNILPGELKDPRWKTG
jgi:hypothetical protein